MGSRPAGRPADLPPPAKSNDETSTQQGLRPFQPRPVRTSPPDETDRKIEKVAASRKIEKVEARFASMKTTSIEADPSEQIEVAMVAPRSAPHELTIRRLGATRTVLGSTVNVKTLPGLSP